MYRELLCRTRNGGAIVGTTFQGLVFGAMEYLTPERYEQAYQKQDLHDHLLIRIG